jgi:preprotein translocase subunit YajC
MVDPYTLLMVAVLAVMVIFMIRNSRKQKADRESLQKKIVTGAEVMSTAGIYGKVVSINDEANEIVIESTPGTKLRLHRQAIASVVDKAAKSTAASQKSTTAKKPASKTASK